MSLRRAHAMNSLMDFTPLVAFTEITIGEPAISRCRALRQEITARVRALVPDGTGLVMPTALGAALPKSLPGDAIWDFYKKALALNAIAGHAGLPQVTIPVAQLDGCPLGLSIVGAPSADRALLAFARSVRERKPHG